MKGAQVSENLTTESRSIESGQGKSMWLFPLSPNKPNLDMTLAITEMLIPNKPNLDMTLDVAEVLSPNKAEVLSPNKPIQTEKPF